MKYAQIKHGDRWALVKDEVNQFACCHCGLVHDLTLTDTSKTEAGIVFEVNSRATAGRRRGKAMREKLKALGGKT